MNIKNLILFCGGRVLEGASFIPKPLMQFGDYTIIDYFFASVQLELYDNIFILSDEYAINLFNKKTDEYSDRIRKKLHIIPCQNNSSTYEKVKSSIKELPDSWLMFTYPDIFVEPYIDLSNIEIEEDQALITQVPIISRFPVVISNNYTKIVKGISKHKSKTIANPHYIFGGHFIIQHKTLNDLLNKQDLTKVKINSLEVVFFNWIASKRKLINYTIDNNWNLADSKRDMDIIINGVFNCNKLFT